MFRQPKHPPKKIVAPLDKETQEDTLMPELAIDTKDLNVLEIRTKPDNPHVKRCEQCKRIRPITDFQAHKLGRDGYGRFCTSCREKLADARAKSVVSNLPAPTTGNPPGPQLDKPTTKQHPTYAGSSLGPQEYIDPTATLPATDWQHPLPEVQVTIWLSKTLEALPTQPQRNQLIRLLLAL